MRLKNVRFDSTQDTFRRAGVAQRLWEKDSSLWKADPDVQDKIRRRLGWLDLPRTMSDKAAELTDFAAEVRKAGFTHAVLLGMGGSSLCPEVLRRTFPSKKGALSLIVLDTTDPGAVLEAERAVNLKKTLFLVASKSGGTIEVDALFRYFHSRLEKLKKDQAGENFIAVTDPDTPLERLAREKKFRRVFLAPPDVGGRYSALTWFGLVPAALLGLDMAAFLNRARRAEESFRREPLESNPAFQLGMALGVLGRAGRDKATFFLPPELASFGLWVEQLVAESTGKEEKGILPVEGEAPMPTARYGNDRVFVFYRLGKKADKALDARRRALEAAGHPVVDIELVDALDLAGEFFRWELAVAVAGIVLEINPFDEPNVAESKANTNRILAQFEAAKVLPEEPPALQGPARLWADPGLDFSRGGWKEAIAAHAARTKPGDYAAIMAYVAPTAANHRALQKFRRRLGEVTGAAVTLGYGPRFLHSTGQFHKGGDDNGVFWQITADDKKDLPIPGAKYSFGALKRAQALGDFQALKDHSRRVLRLHAASLPRALERTAASLKARKKTSA